MKADTKIKIFLPATGILILFAMYLTWEWGFQQFMLVGLGVFFVITPLLKTGTVNRIGERLSRAWF